MSDWADNYDTLATIDDGSCYREGCMFEWANSVGGNYDSLATINDGSCFLNGCTLDGQITIILMQILMMDLVLKKVVFMTGQIITIL